MTEPRRRKVWQHDIENISEDQIREYFHSIGWVVGRLEKDYGEDLFIRIFEDGVFIGRAFFVQLKGTNNIQQYALKTNIFSYQVEVEDLLQWHRSKIPVILVLWDIKQRKGYWLHIQPYVDKQLKKDPTWLEQKEGKRKRNIHIPLAQAIPWHGENALLALVNAEPPLWHVLDDVQQVLDDADPYYRLEAHLTNTGTQLTTVEKYPGASADKPIHIKFRTEIPTTTEEGRSLAERVQQFIDSGVPVKIPFPFIKVFEFPAFIRQSLPEFTEDGFFFLGPVQNPNPLLLRFEVTTDDGEQVTLEFVHLKVIHAGKKEVTLTNEDQPLPIKLKLVLRFNGTIEIDFSTPYTRHVHWLLKQLQLLTCLSKPSAVRLISWETGIPIASVKRETARSDTPSGWWLT